VYGLHYDVAAFTNLTQDHLDYHGTMEEYFGAKKLLFDSLDDGAVAVTNFDDSWGKKIHLQAAP
jgi:UDP-N-acetylmuramoyl-L-alanyl-D-glutamate--2,6-diaminopimelate ligase